MHTARILIIDDDQQTVTDLKFRLTKLGYDVVGTAATSHEAFEKTARLQPSLIMMNTHLRSGTDGIKTGKLIHSKSNKPIIYFSSQAGQETVRRVGSTGPFGFILKPFENSQLFTTIEIALIRYKLENQLLESKQWLDGVMKSIGDGVIAVDKNGVIRFINSTAEKIIGSNELDVVGKDIYEVMHIKDERSGELVDLSGPLLSVEEKNRKNSEIEALLVSHKGKRIFLEINLNPIIDHKNELQGMVLAFRDISSRREAIKNIKQQKERAEALVKIAEQLNSRLNITEVLDTVCSVINEIFNTAATVIFLYDYKAKVFRDSTRKVDLGYTGSTERPIQITFDRDTLQKFLPPDNSSFSITDINSHKDLPFRHILRFFKIRSMAITPLLRNETVVGVIICGSIGSEKKFTKDDLEMLKGLADHVTIAISNAKLFDQVKRGRERQRILAKSLVDAQEAERRRIAQELHDQLGQELTGIQFMLEATKSNAPEKQIKQLEEIQSSVANIIKDVREMSLNLRPSMLDDIGLLPTLQWFFERFTAQTGIKIRFTADKFTDRFSADIEITVFRIIQEALTNIARYAKVKEALVGLALQEDTLWVEILDRGRGFDASAVFDKPTTGLSSMHERTDLAGGYLVVNSYINQGTQILAALPRTDKPVERRKNVRINPFGG